MPFPSTAVLDSFTRADEGPPPSASWADKILSADSNGLKVSGNQLVPGGAPTVPASSYWSAETFGPDVEVFCTIATPPTTAGANPSLWARLATPGVAGTTDGYRLSASAAAGAANDTLLLQRYDNDTPTSLGATINIGADWAAGDGFGMTIIGSTITVYYKPAAGDWTALTTRDDSTYAAAGFIGVRIATDTTIAVDDFGGGTISFPTARLDFVSGSGFPFIAGGRELIRRQIGGASPTQSPRESAGPGPYGGFERYLFPRLHPEIVSGDVTESAPQGGALAAGFEPVAQVATPQGGATGLGNTPLPSVAVPQGGAVAAGQTVTATVTVTAGGALAAGPSPTASTTVTAGGALGAGTTVTTRTTVPQGGGVAAGNPASATTTVTAGGALAAGATPAPQTTLTQGGALAAGVGAPAFVNLSPGGAIAGGFAPSDGAAVTETPVPGGAIAAGVTPTATVALIISGATAQGRDVTLALVPLTRGGATAGGQLSDPLAVAPTVGTQDMAVFISNW